MPKQVSHYRSPGAISKQLDPKIKQGRVCEYMLPRKFYYIGVAAAERSQRCIRQPEAKMKCVLTDRSENARLVEELNTYSTDQSKV